MDFQNKEDRLTFCREKLIPTVKRVIDENVRRPKQINIKGQGNFVTEIDTEIENKLIKELKGLCPNVGFIAEEEESEEGDELNWIIDPIDGTTNFIYDLRFATSVALQDRESSEILMGVVYEPKSGMVYYGSKGCGSYKIVNNKDIKLTVGEFQYGEGIGIFGMPYDRSKADRILDFAKKFYSISSDLKRIGPASLDICMVASGQAKFYFELDLHRWDMTAGLLILIEAGGKYLIKDDFSLFYASSASKEIEALLTSDSR